MNLAPNGQPSNLTPEQYRLVSNPDVRAADGLELKRRGLKRTNKYLVGKEIGGEIYAHKQYESQFPGIEEAKSFLPTGFIYHIVKFNPKTNVFSFIVSSDFDTNAEPSVEGGIVVKPNGETKRFGNAGWIYHHKWMWVADDYKGFNVEESKDRSIQWTSVLDIDKSRIGQRKFWEANVVPLLADIRYKAGGEIAERKETYKKWKSLVNMSKTELEKFYNSQEGKDAGLSSSEASSQGISSGRESARWIMRMKDTPVSEWTPSMWRWANKQISFISRMSGNKGPLYDEKGRKTRKHTSLLIWGHNPKKYELGGGIEDVNTINTIELLNYSVINDFQSGSSLDFYQDLIFVIGDDAKDVVVLYKDFTEAKRVNMFQSETARIPKDVKYDLETSTIVGINGVNNLLILGSGAKQEFRSVGYLIPLNTKYVVPEPFRYNTFVSRLKREDGIKEINIEGCASLPNNFLLANRGNKTNPDNLLIVTENNFWENQENATISVCRMLLPDKDAAVSELNYDERTDTLFFTASIEHTTNAIDDGNIGDSFLGYIKNISQKLNHNTIQIDEFHNLSEVSSKFIGHKIEGMCIENKSGNSYTINLVSDNDNDESTIFKIRIKINN